MPQTHQQIVKPKPLKEKTNQLPNVLNPLAIELFENPINIPDLITKPLNPKPFDPKPLKTLNRKPLSNTYHDPAKRTTPAHKP